MAPNLSTLRPLRAGDFILGIKQIVHIVKKEFKDIYCDNCLKASIDLKKCSKCRYCGKTCQRIDWKYHKKECKLLATDKFKSNKIESTERLFIRLGLTIESDETFASKRHQLLNGLDICLNEIQVDIKRLQKSVDRMNEFKIICNHFRDYGIDFDRKELLQWFGVISTSGISQEFVANDSPNGYSSFSQRKRSRSLSPIELCEPFMSS